MTPSVRTSVTSPAKRFARNCGRRQAPQPPARGHSERVLPRRGVRDCRQSRSRPDSTSRRTVSSRPEEDAASEIRRCGISAPYRPQLRLFAWGRKGQRVAACVHGRVTIIRSSAASTRSWPAGRRKGRSDRCGPRWPVTCRDERSSWAWGRVSIWVTCPHRHRGGGRGTQCTDAPGGHRADRGIRPAGRVVRQRRRGPPASRCQRRLGTGRLCDVFGGRPGRRRTRDPSGPAAGRNTGGHGACARRRGSWPRRWQRAVSPVWPWVAGGCHCDRDTRATLAQAGFDVTGLADDSLVPLPPWRR